LENWSLPSTFHGVNFRVTLMDRLLEATARAERSHFWFRGFRRFVAPLVAEAVGNRTAATILDCGCGTGYNLALLRKYGRAIGVDVTWTGLTYAHDRGERSVLQASAALLPFGDRCFDVVTSFDVIYALEDEDEAAALREMFRVLRPGGHLVLNVAAIEALKGNHSVLAGEVRRYTRASLTGRLAAAGFEVRRMSYTNATILPLVLAVRLLQRVSGREESQTEITIPPAPVNAALSAALAIEAAALRVVNMPFGSSLVALARKTA
jgi:ubiquinone/menaquinone biosynthesis C-methylase UbiE